MHVNVLHSVRRLAGQTRCVDVVNVRDVRVENVEHLQHEASLARQSIANPAIPDRRALRVDAPILNEWARTEMANSKTSKYRLTGLNRHAGRDHSVQGAGDLRADRIAIREPGVCKCQISVDGDPRSKPCVVRPLKPHASAWTAWFTVTVTASAT